MVQSWLKYLGSRVIGHDSHHTIQAKAAHLFRTVPLYVCLSVSLEAATKRGFTTN